MLITTLCHESNPLVLNVAHNISRVRAVTKDLATHFCSCHSLVQAPPVINGSMRHISVLMDVLPQR